MRRLQRDGKLSTPETNGPGTVPGPFDITTTPASGANRNQRGDVTRVELGLRDRQDGLADVARAAAGTGRGVEQAIRPETDETLRALAEQRVALLVQHRLDGRCLVREGHVGRQT